MVGGEVPVRRNNDGNIIIQCGEITQRDNVLHINV